MQLHHRRNRRCEKLSRLIVVFRRTFGQPSAQHAACAPEPHWVHFWGSTATKEPHTEARHDAQGAQSCSDALFLQVRLPRRE